MRNEPQPREGWVGPSMVGLIAAAIGVLAWLSLRPDAKPVDLGKNPEQKREAPVPPDSEQPPDPPVPPVAPPAPPTPVLAAAPTLQGASVAGAALDVHVKSGTGAPIAGAQVRLRRAASPDESDDATGWRVSARVARDAKLRLADGVTGGDGVVHFSAPVLRPCSAWVAAEGFAPTTIHVTDEPSVDIALEPGRSTDFLLVERFSEASDAEPQGRMVEAPVPNVPIVLYDTSPRLVDDTHTDDQGRFHCRGESAHGAAAYVVVVGAHRLSGEEGWISSKRSGVQGSLPTAYVRGGGYVSGRTLDPTGKPVGRMHIQVMIPPRAAEGNGAKPDVRSYVAQSRRFAGAACDADDAGQFHCAYLPLGVEFVLIALPVEEWGPAAARRSVAGGVSEPLRLSRDHRDATIDIRLTRGGTVAVALVGENGMSVSEAEVTGDQGVSRPSVAKPDPDGVFRVTSLFPGPCTLRAKSRLFHEVSVSVDVKDGVETPLRLDVRMGTRVRGVVTDVNGMPVPFANVEVLAPEGGADGPLHVVGGLSADKDGHYDVPLLPAGRLFVRASAPGAATVGDGVEVNGTAEGLRVPVDRLGRARITLSTDDGKPLPLQVEATHGPVDESRPARTDKIDVHDGVVVIDHLDGEAEQLVIDAEGYAPIVRAMQAAPGADVDLGRALLRRGKRLEGSVVDAAGRGIAKAFVVAAGGRATTTTDASGRFEIRGLPDGEVDVRVTADGFLPAVASAIVGVGASLRVALSRAAVLAGVVNDAEGKPAFAVRLVVTSLDAGRDASPGTKALRTDEDGTFRLDLSPGRYRVEAREAGKDAPGDGSVLGDVTLTEGEAAPITFVLPR